MIRYVLVFLVVIVLVIGGGGGFLALRDGRPKYSVPLQGLEMPRFGMMEIPFDHLYASSRGLPFTAGAVIDVDNDGIDELFLGGGVRQSDGLFVFADDRFVNVADQAHLVKQGDDMTLGASVIDYDNNGYQDLVISRESGVWLYGNHGGKFTKQKLDIDIPAMGAPLAVAIADLNRDGHFDFFLPIVGKTFRFDWLTGSSTKSNIRSRLYINNGDNTFSDLTGAAGIDDVGEALQAVFADLDDDGLEDLAILNADGTISTWKNRDMLLFENKSHDSAVVAGDFMGLGVDDYDGDGRIDFLLTNRGETMPRSLLKMLQSGREKRYPKWIVMNNSGDFTFRDVADPVQLADYELARGALFTDLNSDGRADLIVSQNHPYWPPHMSEKLRLKGRVFLRNGSGAFAEVSEQTGIVNNRYGIAPLQADFNNDGRPDIVHLNLGGRSRVFLSKPGENHFLRVQLPGSVRSLGAVVSVKVLSGALLKKTYLVGKTLCSDSTHHLFFGLEDDKAVEVLVEYRDGETDQNYGVFFNRTVVFE